MCTCVCVYFIYYPQNLGHMTKPPMYIGVGHPHIQLNYADGDDCPEGGPGEKHSTIVTLTCGRGTSVSTYELQVCS